MKDSSAALFCLDRELSAKLPEAFRAGVHLPLLYRLAHPKTRLREMNAFRLVRDHPELPLSPETVLTLYQAMTAGTALENRGFRTEDCCIESADFLYFPTPGARVAAAIEALCEKYRFLDASRPSEEPRPEAPDTIFRFLLEFICIHPMEDGNGRLSVFLVQLLLQKAGFRCAPFLPYDYLQNGLYRALYQKHIVKASGIFYGQKPLEYEPFVRFTADLLLDACRLLLGAAEDGQFPL